MAKPPALSAHKAAKVYFRDRIRSRTTSGPITQGQILRRGKTGQLALVRLLRVRDKAPVNV